MTKSKKINLALQGGGAHGAFTWGVLDQLLEDERLDIVSISGTSAGALNAAAFKSGWLKNGRDGAREQLDWVWEQMGAVNNLKVPAWMQSMVPSASVVSEFLDNSPFFAMSEAFSQALSPYSFGPLYSNPLRPVVEKLDFEQVCANDGPQLFIGATNVHSGKIKVFSGSEISVDAILASACLPHLFQAIEIDGEAYWDGGYSGNPALFPLFAPELPDDIVIVNINPFYRPDIPLTSRDIQDRVDEISFNSSLLRELRAIDFVQRLLGNGAIKLGTMKNVHMHMISDDDLMRSLTAATKMVPVPSVLGQLKAAGRIAAEDFLKKHYHDIGEKNSLNLRALFA